jgi:uncharacterized RDD family membrane protein YckC
MESRIEIKTKANLGKRMGAGLIDYGIIFSFLALMFYFYGTQLESGLMLSGKPFYAVIFFWAVMTIGCEQLLGATLGNYMFDLKPVSIIDFNQKNLSLSQSVKRHLLDIVDLWLFGLVALLLIKNTKYNQRLGDLWAKTIVIDTTDDKQGLK